MTSRIEKEPDRYRRIKRYVKNGEREFVAYLEWFEKSRPDIPPLQEEIRDKLRKLINGRSSDSMTYEEIGELVGCSRTTIANIMNSKQRISEDLAHEIIRKLS